MHPILADRRRLALYLITWTLLALLLAIIVMESGDIVLPVAVFLTLPPTMVYAFVCLAAWYPSRVTPLHRAGAVSVVLRHLIAAVVLSAVWLLLIRLWSEALPPGTKVDGLFALFFVTGIFLYLLAVAFHYLLIALELSRAVERRSIELKVLAREAELKALKAQVDPHFLFNSLNSISALVGSNPSSARTLTTMLAEYLRKSLRAGGFETISLSEELELASSYLAIERIRFGPRLEVEQQVDEAVRSFRVPPLLLQPLVENAVTHGIGQLIYGGVVRIFAQRNGDHVVLGVENRCDPDRVPGKGEGIGLVNTRRRIETFYGSSAALKVVDEAERFRVELTLPMS